MEKSTIKVGLEIHQQLATNKKLFCNCAPIESDEYNTKFQRKLRVSKSELGRFDPAALFESKKSKTIVYYANQQSSCLVEQDEEPPHNLDEDAKRITLIIASTLKSNIFNEIYPMRKTVIDGSNTTGFQRTMLVSQGGFYEVEGKKIGIQSICLEEDSAKILVDEKGIKKYGLERLGIPLVEIATEPFEVEPRQIKKIALALGRILRSTKKVTRGLGSIRQDVNVSIKDDIVIEIKGVQQLDQLEKVVEYEAKRQHGLLEISKKFKDERFVPRQHIEGRNVTDVVKRWNSKIIKSAIENKEQVFLLIFRKMAGVFGSPDTEIRLGKDIAELVRSFDLGGIVHSDELPKYGISQSDVDGLRQNQGIRDNDAFLLFTASSEKGDDIQAEIVLRIEEIKNNGIPKDTRLATQSGETKFLRPRPGASRMYPETDVPPISISENEINFAIKNIPKSWDESLLHIQKTYNLNPQLSEQIFDSQYFDLFEKICTDKKSSPTFVASILCSTITNLERQGSDSSKLTSDHIHKSFELLKENKITKESIEIIFENIMSKNAKSVNDAIKMASLISVDENKLNKIIDNIIQKNSNLIKNQGSRSIGTLMGITMKEVRGKASGEQVNKLLKNKIQKYLDGKNKK